MTRRKSSRIADLDAVRSRFEQWRRTRQAKGSIPDELWSAAVAVASRDGICRTAAALRLNSGTLKRHMAGRSAVPRKTPLPAFVEVVAPAAASLPEYTLELEGGRGKLRIHCKGAAAADLAALSRALWDVAG
jgi:hypothetical protein